MPHSPPGSPLLAYTTLFRSRLLDRSARVDRAGGRRVASAAVAHVLVPLSLHLHRRPRLPRVSMGHPAARGRARVAVDRALGSVSQARERSASASARPPGSAGGAVQADVLL